MAVALATVNQTGPELTGEGLAERLQGIVGRLERLAEERVGKRSSIDQRMLEDLQQYWGRYDADTAQKLKDRKKSQLFMNETARMTDAWSARLMDLLFPTDDRCWDYRPTPVPALSNKAKEAAAAARTLEAKAKEAAEAAQMQDGQVDPAKLQEANALKEASEAANRFAAEQQHIMDEAKKRCDLMVAEVDDQLKESLYNAVMRDVIEQACKIGTGVAKGPVTGDKVRKGWKQSQEGGYELKMAEGDQPAIRWVDAWNFFPDLNVANIDDSEGDLERHLMNRKQLRRLAQLKGFDKGAIRRLLEGKPQSAAPSYLADLRNINGENNQAASELYQVWEYTGPLDADDMRHLAMAVGDDKTVDEMAEIDPLKELKGIVWFCQNELLKFAIYPYDSGESMYSVFNFKKDESSIFGYGIPAIVRDPQKSLNAGWRAMMDNAGLASGPQILVDRQLIEPASGGWVLEPHKIWWTKGAEGIPASREPFKLFNIDMNQEGLAAIVAMSKQFLEDMAAMPQMAQGELGSIPKQTPVGTTVIAMNSANVGFRRVVKGYDDDMTTKIMRRYYDWNMQFNPKEEIKGDYCVDARGSSVLLVREMQAQNLMIIALHLGAHPVYGPMLKQKGVLRKLFQAHMIPADDVMLSEDQIDAILVSASAQNEAMQAEAMKVEVAAAELEFKREQLSATVEMANMEMEGRVKIAMIGHETAMMQLAEKMNMNIDTIQAKLTDSREKRASEEKVVAAEIISAKQSGIHAGGKI